MNGLLYILPEHHGESHTHFSYIPPFLHEIGKKFTLRLIVERGTDPKIQNVNKTHIGSKNYILRIIQIFYWVLIARMSGTKIAYVHYSFASAFIASLVFRLTGGTVFYWNCGMPWQYSRKLFRDFFERMTYKFVHFLVTGTEKLADRYAAEYGLRRKNILVMSNWIDIHETLQRGTSVDADKIYTALNIRADHRIVFFAHRLSERKGAQYLPDIAAGLPEGVVLVVAGDGPLKTSISNEIDRRNIRDRVRFLGWISHDEVLRIMNIADVFIMPSDEEGFPHVILEAMALGTPFVATMVGGVMEMTSPNIVNALVPKRDISAFSDEIRKFLIFPHTLIGAWRSETKKWVERYDIRVVLKRFLELMDYAT